MKRWTLIAALAILVVVGAGALVTANAHDGPVTVAVLDAALPNTVVAPQLDQLVTLAAQADLNQYIVSTGGAERIERADLYSHGDRYRSGDNGVKESEPRARDVRGDSARA